MVGPGGPRALSCRRMSRLWPLLRAQLALLAAVALAGAAFWWVGEWIGMPRHRGSNASVLLQPLPSAKALAVCGTLLVTATVTTLLAGRVRYDAGWACTAIGLYSLRLRGGPISSAISDRPTEVFLTLAVELALLGAILAVAWGVLHTLRERGSAFKSLRRVLELPEARARLADRKAAAESLDQKILALVMSAAVMAVMMLILCRSGSRAQVFFAVGISAYMAVWVTHGLIPTRPAIWFWAAPVLCGVVGYLWAWMNTSPAQLAIGEPGGTLAALARPLPLDYASIGIAAALWRYVQSRSHQIRRVIEQQHEAPAPGAASMQTQT